MKPIIHLIFLLPLLILPAACEATTEPPDGFYLEDATGKSPVQLSAKDRQGRTHVFRVLEYTNIAPKTILTYSLKPQERAYQVQLNVTSSDDTWLKLPLILVVDGKPYLEVSKSGSQANSSAGAVSTIATVTLKTDTEREAVHIKERLERRFKLSQ